MQVLVVTNPFRGYGIGDRITDPILIAEIRAGEHSGHAVLTDHADVHHGVSGMPTGVFEDHDTTGEE